MIKLNIHEAKAKLSRYLNELGPDEVIVLCKRNKPIAEIRLVRDEPAGPRPIGLARGQIEVPDTFFEPLPDDVIEGFDGGR